MTVWWPGGRLAARVHAQQTSLTRAAALQVVALGVASLDGGGGARTAAGNCDGAPQRSAAQLESHIGLLRSLGTAAAGCIGGAGLCCQCVTCKVDGVRRAEAAQGNHRGMTIHRSSVEECVLAARPTRACLVTTHVPWSAGRPVALSRVLHFTHEMAGSTHAVVRCKSNQITRTCALLALGPLRLPTHASPRPLTFGNTVLWRHSWLKLAQLVLIVLALSTFCNPPHSFARANTRPAHEATHTACQPTQPILPCHSAGRCSNPTQRKHATQAPTWRPSSLSAPLFRSQSPLYSDRNRPFIPIAADDVSVKLRRVAGAWWKGCGGRGVSRRGGQLQP